METTNDNLIDKQLYISMQQGNKKAFDTLFIKYYAMLCAFARSFVSKSVFTTDYYSIFYR